MSLGKLIQKGRQDKGMTQKELATKICEKPQVVNEYELGKGIPNNQIMIKIEKAIGIKLRGKDKGKCRKQRFRDRKISLNSFDFQPFKLGTMLNYIFRSTVECAKAKEIKIELHVIKNPNLSILVPTAS